MNKEDWIAWKDSYVTKAFFEACKTRIEDAKDMLSQSAGIDPNQDNFSRGFIHAYREIENFTVEDL